jgi:hypothetical protein
VRLNPGPATRHIPRRCGTCRFWKIKDDARTFCNHPSLRKIPAIELLCSTRPEEGTLCPLWNPMQEEIRRGV